MTAPDWLDICTRDEIPALTNASGSIAGGAPKILWHTTEGATYAGARAAYQSGNGPHITATNEDGRPRAYQHLPLSQAASALVHNGGETNRDNVTQIEIVGTCDPNNRGSWPHGSFVDDFTPEFLAFLGQLARAIETATGCAHTCGVTFKPYPESYGDPNGVRLAWDVWDAYSGHLGHQHAPENLHGDPGDLAIATILGTPPPAPPPLPPILQTGDPEVPTKQPLQIATDENGNGDGIINVPFAKALGVTANGSDPEANHGFTPIPALSYSDFNGQTKVELEGGIKRTPGHQPYHLVWVTVAA